MKKSILSIAIALFVFSSSFAAAPAGNERAVASFHKEFNTASDVKWTATDNFVQATFTVDKQTLFAYYDFDGNLVGVVHHILTNSLPADLEKDIKKGYSNYWVSELFEISTEQGKYYYIQLKNADESIVLTTEGTGSWHKYAVSKKVANL
jgi:hypothetical protein